MSPKKFKVKLDLRTKINMVESQAITLKSYKVKQLVDKSTAQLDYKQKAKFTSTEKYVVKVLGFTTECQTQVKFKESVYPNKAGSSSSESNYNNNKNRSSVWKWMRIASATKEFPKKSN